MLLYFKCDNFKTFRDGFYFNMEPEKITELGYSVLDKKVNGKSVRALSASVIYGPNAAGKSSVINAMSCLRQIVLRGNIKDAEDDKTRDHVSAKMVLAPFAFQTESRPISFDISFVTNGIKVRYCLSFFVGAFLQYDSNRYIDGETLYINDNLVFERTKDTVTHLSVKSIRDYLNVGFSASGENGAKKAMGSNITVDSLLLTTDFFSFCSKKLVNEIREWFNKQFVVINSSNRIRFTPSLSEDDSAAFVDERINRIAQEAGITGGTFAYANDPERHKTKLISLWPKNDQNYGIDAEKIESIGTIRLVSIMPAILSALQTGSVLVMDELDASFHPMIVMNLISLFHNDNVNIKGAQIIFNTHNPIYLNHDLLRRDEIKFVERDKETKSSSLYALSDFRTNGEASVRKTNDYMKNYFINRYGAIEDIDFTDIVLEILGRAKKDET